jgi:type IV pilus assembly protein PilM
MRILGIDFGTWSVKAVEMESRWRRLEILDFHEVKMPLQLSEPVPMYKSAVEQLLSTLPSHPDKIVTSIPSSQSALRFLRIPIPSKKKVEQMFRFELEDNIPFRLDDSVLEHRISPDGKGNLVFAAISPKKFVQNHIDWCKSVGVDPDWLTFEGMGALNLFLTHPPIAQGDQKATGPVLFCDIGHSKTNVSVLEGPNLVFHRNLSWGSFRITEALAENLSQALEEAEDTKHLTLNLEAPDFAVDGNTMDNVVGILKNLVSDITHTIAAYRSLSKKEIAKVFLTGGGSELKGLTQFLSEAIGVPTERYSPFSVTQIKEELKQKDQYRFSESWGRAQVFTRKSPLLLNFRKGELGKHTSLDDVGSILKNPHLVKLLQFSAVLAVVLLVHVTLSTIVASKQASNAEEALGKIFQDTFRSVPQKARTHLIANPPELRKYIDQKVRELDQKIQLVSKSHVAMGTLFKKVSASFPAEVRVDVNTLELDDKNLKIQGVLYQGDINQVVEALKATTYFSQVTSQTEGGNFTISGKVVGR